MPATRSKRSFTRLEERFLCRAGDAAGLDVLEVLHPRLSIVGRPVGVPREAVGLDVVVADAQYRGVGRADAELLLEVEFVSVAMPRAEVLQTEAGVGRGELPSIEQRVVRADRSRDVHR